MEIRAAQGDITQIETDALIVNLFTGVTAPGGATGAVDRALDGGIGELIAGGDFRGKLEETAVLYPRGALPARRIIVVGLGAREKFDLNAVRRASGAALRRAQAVGADHVATIAHGAGIGGLSPESAAQATVEGGALALHRYDGKRRKEDDAGEVLSLTVVEWDDGKMAAVRAGVAAAKALVAGVTLARNLVLTPPNVATPIYLAEVASGIAERHGMALTVGDRTWAEAHAMGAFLAVAQGAGHPPRFIILEHRPEGVTGPPVVLVGKGITFDTGGISIKPSQGMGDMKGDMGGAAAVLGTMETIGALALPRPVVALVPCTENMPDAHAYRPSDVIRAANGTTIEVISTDAEGRMILADALVYAQRYAPMAVVDLATLTGSVSIALGAGVAAGVFTRDAWLSDRLVAAGKATHERLWPLPLWDEYTELIQSDVADIKNSGGRYGGASIGAAFLSHFVDYPWAHLDIAGMTFTEKPQVYETKNATGYGVRLLVALLRAWE